MKKLAVAVFCLFICSLFLAQPLFSAPAESLRLKKFSYIDREGIGIEAFSLLMPATWKFSGGIRWNLNNPGMPAAAQFKVTSPSEKEEIEVFPTQSMFWTNNRMLLTTFPTGARYFGAEVHPVVEPAQALSKIILPRFRGNVSELKVISRKDLPGLDKSIKAGANQPDVKVFSRGAKMRIEYTRAGVPMEEEIFAVVSGYSFGVMTMQGPVTNTNWFVDYIFSYKAPKGQLDKNARVFQAITLSFKLNPQWFNKYNQLVYNLIQAQIKQIHSIGELSRYISRTSNEISDSMMKSYYDRQKVYDGISENFSNYIRGTDNYYNPMEGKQVELPSGYNHVWANPNGEYVFTDNPNDNPNIGSNLNWQELKAK